MYQRSLWSDKAEKSYLYLVKKNIYIIMIIIIFRNDYTKNDNVMSALDKKKNYDNNSNDD